jgi:hypothetical protein
MKERTQISKQHLKWPFSRATLSALALGFSYLYYRVAFSWYTGRRRDVVDNKFQQAAEPAHPEESSAPYLVATTFLK